MIKSVSPKTLPPPPPPPVAQKGDVQLDGLYLQVRTWLTNGRMTLEHIHYYFLPDGHLFYGIPPGGTVKPNPGGPEWAALEKSNPKSCGVYRIKGDTITFQFPGEKPQVHKFAFEKPGNPEVVMVDGVGAVKVGRFKNDQTLNGRYEAGVSSRSSSTGSSTPDSYLAASNTLDFHLDGTFGKFNIGVFETKSASGGSSSTDGGKYSLWATR